jgi:hypothetical protein
MEARTFTSRAVAGLSTGVNCARDLSHVTSIYHHRNDRFIFHQWPPSKPRRPSSNNSNNSSHKLSFQNRKQRRKQRRSKNTSQSKCLCFAPQSLHVQSFAHSSTVFSIHYSDRYTDDEYEYRHVILPKPLFKMIPKTYFNPDDPGVLRLLSEAEWRGIGITQSLGWEHYEVHGTLSLLYPLLYHLLTATQRLL